MINILKHQIVINVKDNTGENLNVLKGAEMKLRTRFLDFLFGKQHKMLILVPSETMHSVEIREIGEVIE